MKKLVALIVLALVAFLVVNRYRVYLRDPIATVTRDGIRLGDQKVYINYPSDILLQDGSGTVPRLYIVQHWNTEVGTPTVALKCIQGVACMADADHATAARVSRIGNVNMTSRQIDFNDENNAHVTVTLR